MSSNNPPNRRRIAGENKASAPAKKAVSLRKPPAAKKMVAKPTAPTPPAPTPVAKAATVAEPRVSRLPSRELRWLVPAALVTVAALVVGSWALTKGISERGSGIDSSNSQAATAASAAAETIFSFRYDKLPTHLNASKKVMTKSFAKDFDKIAPALTELAPQRKIVVQAVTREAAATDCGNSCSPTKANVLVFVDQVRQVGGTAEPTVFGNRITVSMVKQDGTWLVNDIRAL